MDIQEIDGCTRIFGAPEDWDQSKTPCIGLPVMDAEVEGHGNVMISQWMPTAEELEALNNGMPIHLWVYGDVHPVVSITVGEKVELADLELNREIYNQIYDSNGRKITAEEFSEAFQIAK